MVCRTPFWSNALLEDALSAEPRLKLAFNAMKEAIAKSPADWKKNFLADTLENPLGIRLKVLFAHDIWAFLVLMFIYSGSCKSEKRKLARLVVFFK